MNMLASTAATLRSSLCRNQRTATAAVGAVRNLNVHEYISMEIMNAHHIPTPRAYVAKTPEEAEAIYTQKLAHPNRTNKDAVIKAQVLSGGRGLGTFENGFKGGVHMVTKPGQAFKFAEKMLGNKLITKQAPNGIPCNKVFLMERVYIRREMYLSILMDRASQGPMLVGSPYGGTSIEDVAKENPDAIFTESIDITKGIQEEQCKRMAVNLGCDEGTLAYEEVVKVVKHLYEMFLSCDCTQVEINPLAETPEGNVVVCDAKVNFDDNAEFRQKDIFERRDSSQEDPREVEASKYDLNYIGLDGNIGCMVNGAGLAMSTMDIIQLKGGKPANFLDVGGGATEGQVQKAFEILNADPNVQAILVNIFGGIMRCDVIAVGIINAAKEIGLKKPIVIRLQGTNVEKAKEIIDGCGFKMILANDLDDAAAKAVGVAEIAKQADKLQLGVKFEGLHL